MDPDEMFHQKPADLDHQLLFFFSKKDKNQYGS